jgi:ABC-type spermidine/putrescine transport system permease subunit I
MRDGSLAMGATKSETIQRVLFPAALPGIVAGVMLVFSPEIGAALGLDPKPTGGKTQLLAPNVSNAQFSSWRLKSAICKV